MPPGSVTLAWDAPTSNADGSPLNDLVGYRIYDGVVSGVYDMVTDVGAVTQFSFDALSPGTYFFAVTAYDTFGNESVFSGEIQVSVGP
ncbi:MAG: fibronectin type III domain-containing protein [Planctomycetota bacterium]|nr:fibronectin type III domain-containing protein [Planctomycetota bacterium]